jgi:hypothetical protein
VNCSSILPCVPYFAETMAQGTSVPSGLITRNRRPAWELGIPRSVKNRKYFHSTGSDE